MKTSYIYTQRESRKLFRKVFRLYLAMISRKGSRVEVVFRLGFIVQVGFQSLKLDVCQGYSRRRQRWVGEQGRPSVQSPEKLEGVGKCCCT